MHKAVPACAFTIWHRTYKKWRRASPMAGYRGRSLVVQGPGSSVSAHRGPYWYWRQKQVRHLERLVWDGDVPTDNLLSGSRQRQVAVARALMRRSQTLLADDPVSPPDPRPDSAGRTITRLSVVAVAVARLTLAVQTARTRLRRSASCVLDVAQISSEGTSGVCALR